MTAPTSHTSRRCILGLFLTIFSLLALTSPGRIDIVDGQTRYEVARSLVDYGDTALRDEHVWFGRFPGRGGLDFAKYRFPQSALGVPAIFLSDLTGARREARRHYFFVLTSAVAGAGLAALFFVWFARRGLTARAALFWAAAGVVCTPAWFYATSTFDDILGSVAVVAALVTAGPSPGRAGASGLLIGLAFNCKPPLAAFGLPVLVALRSDIRADRPWGLWALAASGMAAGVAGYVAYEAWKFPPGLEAAHAALQLQYVPIWPSTPWMNLVVLAVSPSAGAFWYCPPALISVIALRGITGGMRWALLVSTGVFVLFIGSLSIFKGDPAWGPRYLTPVFAALWLYAPDGARRLPRMLTAALLTAGLVVQVLALSVDPHRLYVERDLPSAFGAIAPVLYFDARNAHLLNRPREVVEVWRARHERAPAFSPAPTPTFAFPVLDRIERGPAAVRRYKLLNAFRPWWWSFAYMPPAERPVSLGWTAGLQLCLVGVGIALIARGLRRIALSARAPRVMRRAPGGS